MMQRIEAVLARREEGMSLVELLIYSMLLVVILGIAGAILINALNSQRIVTTISGATSDGQLISTSVGIGIRNASAFQAATPTAFGQMLSARTQRVTSTGVSTWQCQSWFRTTTGEFYVRAATSAIAVPASAAGLSGWTLVTKGANLPSSVAQAFTASSGQLTLSLSMSGGTSKPVLISTTFVSRPQTDTGTAPTTCF